jgi:hypothetical protein
VRAAARRAEHRREHVARALHRFALAAEMEPIAVDPDDDRDERFERADVAIARPVEPQVIVEVIQRERRFGRRTSR